MSESLVPPTASTESPWLVWGRSVFALTIVAILLGLGGEDREPLIAALLIFRLLYHFLPFVIALGLFGAVEGWRSLRARRQP